MNSGRSDHPSLKGERGLGLGFGEGNSFHLFRSEPYKGLINAFSLPEELMEKIRDLLKQTISKDKKGRGTVQLMTETIQNYYGIAEGEAAEIVKDMLGLVMPDVLVDINVTRLAKILPVMIESLPHEIKELFIRYGLSGFNDADGKRFLKSVIVSRYKLFSAGTLEESFQQKIAELKLHLTMGSLHKLDGEIMAYLIPAILDRMQDEDLRRASFALAERLEGKYFGAIADKNYFVPQIHAGNNDGVRLKNANKRSIQFFADPSATSVRFRGAVYGLQHTHIHFERDGEENEYDLDNARFDGEIHTVFEVRHKNNVNKIRLIAVGFPLMIGSEDNPRIKQLLDAINQLDVVKKWKSDLALWESTRRGARPELLLDKINLDIAINYKELFMEHIDRVIKDDALLLHSWGSLRSDTYGFRAGLRFMIAPKPIHMSEKQYRELKAIFGEMETSLLEKDKLDPIDRKAGHREARKGLSASLLAKVVKLKPACSGSFRPAL